MKDTATMNICGIRQKSSGYWWECSTEHGAGWTTRIRQAWTYREATNELLAWLERGWSVDNVEIVELGPLR